MGQTHKNKDMRRAPILAQDAELEGVHPRHHDEGCLPSGRRELLEITEQPGGSYNKNESPEIKSDVLNLHVRGDASLFQDATSPTCHAKPNSCKRYDLSGARILPLVLTPNL